VDSSNRWVFPLEFPPATTGLDECFRVIRCPDPCGIIRSQEGRRKEKGGWSNMASPKVGVSGDRVGPASKYTPACAGRSGRTSPLHILQQRQGDRVGPHHFPCWDPKTYQLDQTYGIQGKVGDKEGGSCHKGRRIIFPKGPTINPKSWHFEIQSGHSLGESNPRPYD